MKLRFFFILVALLAFLYEALSFGPSRYVVVIDPGHGGLSLTPISLHGDKYDPIQKKYLAAYQEGASNHKLHESEIAYEIGSRAKEILDLTNSAKGREEFRTILGKYTDSPPEKIEPVKVLLSRDSGYPIADLGKYDGKTDRDYNELYRLFDFPDFKSGERRKGLISRINEKKPNLVVSIHLDSNGPPRGAMAAVVTPGYDTYKMALDYVKGDAESRKKIHKAFMESPYLNWLSMGGYRSSFQWFLCDAWIYFTGYWSNAGGLEANTKKYRGLRHDMVSWKYDGGLWDNGKDSQLMNSHKISDLRDFPLDAAFWEREASEPERWRRENGKEGVGGDNLYSSNEILRFIRMGLLVNKDLSEKALPDIREPHWSTWSLPTYLNAVTAFIELGFLNNRYDRARIENYKNSHAEGIAVGIYSLLFGLHVKKVKPLDMPAGDPVDFERYQNYKGSDYFKSVSR